MLALVLLATAANASSLPGIRSSVSWSFFNDLKELYMDNLFNSVEGQNINDITYLIDTWLYKATLNITDIELENEQSSTANSYLAFNPRTQEISCVVTNLDATIGFDFLYHHWSNIMGKGEVKFLNSTISITMKLWADSANKLQAKVTDVEVNHSSFDLTFESNNVASMLLKVFSRLWPINKIGDLFLHIVLSRINNNLNPKIAAALAEIPYEYVIPKTNITLDYHVFDVSIDNQLYIGSSINGTVFYQDINSGITLPSAFPEWNQLYSLRLQASQYVFNTLLASIQEANILTVQLTDADIPATVPFELSTTGLSKLIPALTTTYGANLPVQIQVYSEVSPKVVIDSAIDLYLNATILFQVNNGTLQNAFAINMGLNTQLYLDFTTQTDGSAALMLSLNSNSTEIIDVKLASSQIGPVNVSEIQSLTNWILDFVARYANSRLQSSSLPIPLPKGIKVVMAEIDMMPGFIEIDAVPIIG